MIWPDIAVIERGIWLWRPVWVPSVLVGADLGEQLQFGWLCFVITPPEPRKETWKIRKIPITPSHLIHNAP